MDDEKIYGLFEKLADKLQANTDALRDLLANHEIRIVKLESSKQTEGEKPDRKWSTQIIFMLVKALLIATGIIAGGLGVSQISKSTDAPSGQTTYLETGRAF